MKKFLFTALMALSNLVFAGEPIVTPFGLITIESYTIKVQTVNGEENIPFDPNVISVYLKEQLVSKAEDAALIVFIQYSGRPECSAKYFIYEMNANGQNKKTDPFGTCSDQARVKKEENGIVSITMDDMNDKTYVTYEYEDGEVFEIVKAPEKDPKAPKSPVKK